MHEINKSSILGEKVFFFYLAIVFLSDYVKTSSITY